jgi:hypothetical protein
MQRDKTPGHPGDLDPVADPTACTQHPARDEWMAWLYDELPRNRHSELKAHLASCPQCATQVAAWQAAMKELDAWTAPAPAPREASSEVWRWSNGFKWAAAAAVMLSAGFLAGRLNSAATPEAVRAAVATNVSQQMQAARAELASELNHTLLNQLASLNESNRVEVTRLFADLASTISEGRAADQQNVLAALKELDARWLGIYASFRRELETVAILTETELKDTQQQLVQMANFNDINK